ncbi:MAG: restriction endonuclease subunit S, partial [Holosporaceae bacterium]|jgi:type I restriction enzyme S subunit|nr:restriction endonuclease subunit S [Holosporaceae bacterium]
VDFEPVKAKSEGRRPEGLAPEIANLFPSSFVDSPLGKIPEGWEVKALDKIIQINPTTSVDRMRPVTFVDMKALPISGFSIMNFEKKIYSNGAKFRNGDILIARITPCLENGKTGMVDFLDDNESGFGSTEFIVLRGASSIQTPYIACLSRNNEFRAHCIKHMNGSSGRQRVSTSCFSDFYMPIPTKNSLLDLFHKVCVPIFKKITYNARTTQSLIELRDILLPPLTCGTIHPLFMES